MTLAPIFRWLGLINLDSPFQRMIVRATLAPLPAKEEALEGAGRALEAEDKMMEVETWAIDQLNEHQREVLQTSYVLQRAIGAQGHGQPGETSASQLKNASRLQSELVKETELTTAEIHGSHQKHNRAEAEKEKIEVALMEIANMDDIEFWIAAAGRVNEARATQQEAPEDGGGWWPNGCVIL